MPRKFRKTRKQGKVTSVRLNSVYHEPSRFPKLPEEFQTSLVYVHNEDKTAGQTTPWNMIQPLIEFNTNLPRFCAALYQIYRWARIMRIDVEGQVTNTHSTEPIYTTMAVMPFVDASVSTLLPQTVSDWPRARVFQTGPLNGLGRTRFKGSFPVSNYLGEENVGRSFLQDYSQAITSGVQGEFPAIYIGNTACHVGNTWAGQFEIRFTMHIRFSGLNYPSLGLIKLKRQLDEEGESISEEAWVEPQQTPSKCSLKKNLPNPQITKGSCRAMEVKRL